MKSLDALFDRILAVTAVIPGVIIALLAVGICAEVFARNFDFTGFYWMLDAVEYGLLLLTMVGAAYVLSIGRHVTVDIFVGGFSPPAKRRLAILVNAISLTASGIIVYYGILATIQAYGEDSTLYKSIEIKEWVPMAVVPGGMTLFAIECLRQLVHSVRSPPEAFAASQDRPEVF